MHVDHLSITFTPSHRSSDNDKRVLVHEIPYASFVLCAVARLCEQVEFEG